MSYRNSFTKCVSAMSVLFGQERYPKLYITHCESGKYYTLLTEAEYIAKLEKQQGDIGRLVVCLTAKELRLFNEYKQADLFSNEKGKQSHNNKD